MEKSAHKYLGGAPTWSIQKADLLNASVHYVSCGTFEGGDRSASAIGDVPVAAHPPAWWRRSRRSSMLGYASVPVDIAALLLEHAEAFRARLVARLGHDDPGRADREAREAGETRLRRRTGREPYRADDVIRACKTSAAEREPVGFSYL